MSSSTVALLGPRGTYADIVAHQRFTNGTEFVPMPVISEVFNYVRSHSGSIGIVPIENSSGGSIHNTIDGLIEHCGEIFIREQMSLNVKLALLGNEGEKISVLYSHFAPFKHCDRWLNENMPGVARRDVSSTGEAARIAASEQGAGALAARASAELYGLDILEYPIESDVNVTDFVMITAGSEDNPEAIKTSLVVSLANSPGALCDFLKPFSENKVNLSRMVSRNIHGQPNTYRFFVDVDGTERDPAVKVALQQAAAIAQQMSVVGVYPVLPTFDS